MEIPLSCGFVTPTQGRGFSLSLCSVMHDAHRGGGRGGTHVEGKKKKKKKEKEDAGQRHVRRQEEGGSRKRERGGAELSDPPRHSSLLPFLCFVRELYNVSILIALYNRDPPPTPSFKCISFFDSAAASTLI